MAVTIGTSDEAPLLVVVNCTVEMVDAVQPVGWFLLGAKEWRARGDTRNNRDINGSVRPVRGVMVVVTTSVMVLSWIIPKSYHIKRLGRSVCGRTSRVGNRNSLIVTSSMTSLTTNGVLATKGLRLFDSRIWARGRLMRLMLNKKDRKQPTPVSTIQLEPTSPWRLPPSLLSPSPLLRLSAQLPLSLDVRWKLLQLLLWDGRTHESSFIETPSSVPVSCRVVVIL